MKKNLCLAALLVAVTVGAAFGAGGKTVINYYEWDVPNLKFVEEFNAANPDIEVVVHTIPANAERATKLDILAMSGSDMDVMPIADGDQFIRFEKGLLAPLDSYIARDKLDIEDSFGKYAEWGKGSNDKYYGIPFRATQTMVYYNKTMFDAAKVPYPKDNWTLDEYVDTARKMAAWGKAKGIYGTYTHTYQNEWATIAGQVGTWYTAAGKCNISDPAWVRALKTRKMLDDEGTQMSFGQIKASKAVINSTFLGGKSAMVTAGSWLVRDMKNKEKFPFDFEVGVAYMPRFDAGVPGLRSNFSASILGIPANSKHKDEAWRFIRYYVEKASGYIAASGNMPTYLPAYTSGIVDTFRKDSGLAANFAAKFFDRNVKLSTNKILADTGAAYMQIINDEVNLYFTGERSLEQALANIENKVNKEIVKK